MANLTRRQAGKLFLGSAGLAGLAAGPSLLASLPAMADETGWRHGISLFGSLKYPAGFAHFDYVNPSAPKGGYMRRATMGTFDTLNPFNIKGTPAAGAALIYDTLMTSAHDEPSTMYGLLAEAVRHPADYSSVTYRLRDTARFHDGQPVTADDVIWSLNQLRETSPFFNAYYANIVAAEETAPGEVTFTFDQAGNRELPHITGQLFVLPKHYWQDRAFDETTLDPPLGSGPYRIKTIDAGRRISYERVADYWGADLNVNVGKSNFDEQAFEYYRDVTVLFEAFKSDAFDIRLENSAKRWATGYDFPARARGEVILETFRTKSPEPMQGYVLNLRRARFQDPRVRLAFNYAFDFEWLNENIFFDQYERIDSYFQNSELAATGLPEGRELEVLEPLRDLVPVEVFTEEFRNPVGGGQRAMRENLRTARQLLAEAGWEIQDGVLTNVETGEPMTVEFLTASPDSERVIAPYLRSLERLGVQGTIRTVDVSQYVNRMDEFDFDITTSRFPQSLSPGNEQRDFWGSEAAGRSGSRNTIGIQDEAVDRLIDKIIFADNREDLVAASRALDRVLLWNHYIIPQFFTADIRMARWNRYSFPETRPEYVFSLDAWWFDQAKAATIRDAS